MLSSVLKIEYEPARTLTQIAVSQQKIENNMPKLSQLEGATSK